MYDCKRRGTMKPVFVGSRFLEGEERKVATTSFKMWIERKTKQQQQ